MASKVRTFFPSYQLRFVGESSIRKYYLFRSKDGDIFTTKLSMFGTTKTHREVIKHLGYMGFLPIVCIAHEEVQVPDRRPFIDPNELHRRYIPLTMMVANVQCLGEITERIFKVYFCKILLHEDARGSIKASHNERMGYYIVPA